jgi:D-amino-acid dehydrogenase
MHCQTLVLGAGIVGVSTALHLQARGRQVILIDRDEPGSGTSHGNAGLIERSSVIPYAFPRQLGALLRYGLNRQPDVRYSLAHLPKAAPWLCATGSSRRRALAGPPPTCCRWCNAASRNTTP